MNVNFVSQHSVKTHIKCVFQRVSGTDERGRFLLPACEPSTLKTYCTLRFFFPPPRQRLPALQCFYLLALMLLLHLGTKLSLSHYIMHSVSLSRHGEKL